MHVGAIEGNTVRLRATKSQFQEPIIIAYSQIFLVGCNRFSIDCSSTVLFGIVFQQLF